ncbi:MAG: 6-phosphofructokinase [Verrucomicrobiota bacterium]
MEVVTGGGDCPGLNTVIRAVAKASAHRGWNCLGILGGYEGLLEPRRTMPLDYQVLSGFSPRAGARILVRPIAANSPPRLGMAKDAHCRWNCSMA